MHVTPSARLPLPELIALRAHECPDDLVYVHVEGDRLTYRGFHERALAWAGALEHLGVRQGDLVVTMLPVSTEAWPAWIGLSSIGAVEVPVNPQLRGALLDDVLQRVQPKAIVLSHLFTAHLLGLAHLAPEVIVVVADSDVAPALPCRVVLRDDLFDAPRRPSHSREVKPRDIACVLFTSGTTGPSKGVQVPWRMLMHGALAVPDGALRDREAYYFFWAMYHAGGKYGLYIPTLAAGSVVARDRFSASEFWNDIRRHGCTFTTLAPPVVHFLLQSPTLVGEHPLRGMWCAPVTDAVVEFGHRFGVQVATTFGMTEIGIPIATTGWGVVPAGTCGRVRPGPPGYEVRLVDENDEAVVTGQSGELMIRSGEPWALNAGYHGLPEHTAESWRNGWFHTGDVFKMDDDGNLTFVDRRKDCIRRRGENISSFEVERFVMEHPDVAECAAVGVPSEIGDEEVLVFVVAEPEAEIRPAELSTFLEDRMPQFMRPRYLEVVAELPRTEATRRVRKHELRARGVTPATWDRAAISRVGV